MVLVEPGDDRAASQRCPTGANNRPTRRIVGCSGARSAAAAKDSRSLASRSKELPAGITNTMPTWLHADRVPSPRLHPVCTAPVQVRAARRGDRRVPVARAVPVEGPGLCQARGDVRLRPGPGGDRGGSEEDRGATPGLAGRAPHRVMIRAAQSRSLLCVGETTPTPPRTAAPHGARQVTVSGNNVGKTTSPSLVSRTVCATVWAMPVARLITPAASRRGQPRPGRPSAPPARYAGAA